MSKAKKFPGIKNAVEALQNVDSTTYKSILKNIASENPELVSAILKNMFVFEDLQNINPKGLQGLIAKFKYEEWALAFKTASDEVKEAIYAQMSERAGKALKEEALSIGPKKLSDVEKIQAKIVEIALEMEKKGELIRSKDPSDPLV